MLAGIVGLPRSGKTTIFNAVTRGRAETAGYSVPQGKPNLGVAKLRDPRLDRLAEIYGPRRVVQAEVSYLDVPPPLEGVGETRGIAGEHLNNLQNVNTLLVVVRAFEDPSVTHVDDTIDPLRDAEAMLLELTFSDLEILERRLARLADRFKGAKAPEREALTREQTLMERLRSELEGGASIRDLVLSSDEARLVEGFQFLTAKPLILVVNAGEDQMSDLAPLEERLTRIAQGPKVRTVALCGLLEMELAQMDPDDEQEFREELGVGESGLERVGRLSYDVEDLITFFTGNDNEVRAWLVPDGTVALKAAGKVHSDFERGFIRAEVVHFDDLDDCGTLSEARKCGVLRREGKDYVVKDGDVLNILFNV